MKRSVFEHLDKVDFTAMRTRRLHRTRTIAVSRLGDVDGWLAFDKDPRAECIAAHSFFVEYIGRIESELAMRSIKNAMENL
jgi:hypothetical protein